MLTCRSKSISPVFIFRKQIKIFLMKSESFLRVKTATQLPCSRPRKLDVTWTIIIMSLLPLQALNVSVGLLSMQGQKAGFHQKYLYLCSEDE